MDNEHRNDWPHWEEYKFLGLDAYIEFLVMKLKHQEQKLNQQSSKNSWDGCVDRQGGAFSADEIMQRQDGGW